MCRGQFTHLSCLCMLYCTALTTFILLLLLSKRAHDARVIRSLGRVYKGRFMLCRWPLAAQKVE